MKVLILYGSSRGRTKSVALELAKLLGNSENFPAVDVHDIKDGLAIDWKLYQGIIMGSSTWDRGDLQRDFYKAEKDLEKIDLLGKWTAIFSCASILYPYYAESRDILENLAGRMKLRRLVSSLVVDDLDRDLEVKLTPWVKEIQKNLRFL